MTRIRRKTTLLTLILTLFLAIGAIFALVDQGAIGNLLEIESADGNTVRIFVE